MADIFQAVFINQLMTNAATLFDSFVVGRFYGEICLSSTGIVYQLVFFLITLGSIFSIGSQLECSLALPKGEQHRVSDIFSASMILIGIHAYYEPEQLVGKTCIAIVNLPPRKMMGIDSCGMLISVIHKEGEEEKLHLLMVDPHIPAGAKMY